MTSSCPSLSSPTSSSPGSWGGGTDIGACACPGVRGGQSYVQAPLRHRIRSAREGVARAWEAALSEEENAEERFEDLVERTLRARADGRRFQEETDAAVVEAETAMRTLQDAQRRKDEAERERNSLREAWKNEAVSRAARAAADVAKVRHDAKEVAARARTEHLRLDESLEADRRVADQAVSEARMQARRRVSDFNRIGRDAAEAVGRSARRAAAALRPRGDLAGAVGLPAIESTLDWLAATERAFKSISSPSDARPEQVTVSGNCWLPECPDPVDGSDESGIHVDSHEACLALQGTAARMAVEWAALIQAAAAGAGSNERERTLVGELHAARERACALEEQLGRKQKDVEELQDAVAFENRQTSTVIADQRWLVPRVASAVSAELPDPPVGAWPPWEEYRPRTSDGRSSTTVVGPALWAGYRCDRQCDRGPCWATAGGYRCGCGCTA